MFQHKKRIAERVCCAEHVKRKIYLKKFQFNNFTHKKVKHCSGTEVPLVAPAIRRPGHGNQERGLVVPARRSVLFRSSVYLPVPADSCIVQSVLIVPLTCTQFLH